MSATSELQLVRVFLGPYSIADYHADKDLADRYTAAMGLQFGGLRITIESAPEGEAKPLLPNDERQWPLTAFGGGGR
ncbi:MAG TPA: hypothetical protein VGD71_21760 [Kribbella sp.]